MKRLLLVLCIAVFCVNIGFAEAYELNLGSIKLYMPLQDASLVGLLDLNHDMTVMSGAETSFGKIANTVDLSIGGVTSEAGKGTPYGSLGYTITETQAKGILEALGFDKFKLAGFAGYDFSIKSDNFIENCRIGLNFSTEIMGLLEIEQ